MQELPDRTPPHSIDAEQYTLSCALRNADARERVLEKLDTGDWYLEHHRWIFNAVATLHRRKPPFNTVSYETVAEELRKRGQLDAIGGIAYLLTLHEAALFPAQVDAYLDPVWEAAVRRRVIAENTRLTALAYDESAPLEQLEAGVQQRADAPLARDLGAIIPASVWMQDTGDAYGPRAVGQTQNYFRTGFPKLDSYVEFAGGDLIIIAARPSVGKTALALEMMVGGALLGQPVGLISLEMNRTKVGIRMQCSYTGRYDLNQGVALPTLRDHAKPDSPEQLTPEEEERIAVAEAALGMLPMFIVDESAVSLRQLAQHARQMHRKHGVKAIFVDYLQKLDYGDQESMRIGTTLVARQLKTIARQLNLPVIALSQLTRRTEQRGKSERRPLLSDLKESGAIEEEADGVILLHREDYYQRSETPGMDDGEGGMEAIVAKSRNGATGIVRLQTSLRCGRIYEAGTYRDDAPPEHYYQPQRPRGPEAAPEEEWWR